MDSESLCHMCLGWYVRHRTHSWRDAITTHWPTGVVRCGHNLVFSPAGRTQQIDAKQDRFARPPESLAARRRRFPVHPGHPANPAGQGVSLRHPRHQERATQAPDRQAVRAHAGAHRHQRPLTRAMEERRDAERKSHAKDAFLAMLGHELRNRLSAISSASSRIDLAHTAPDTVARAMPIIQRQTQHLTCIVEDLLDRSALLGACLETFRATGPTRGNTVTCDLRPATCRPAGSMATRPTSSRSRPI